MIYRIILILLLVQSLAYILAARAIPLDPWSLDETINSRTMPTLYGSLLAIVLIGLLLKTPPDVPRPQRVAKTLGIVALLTLFAAAVPFAGLWIPLGCLLALCLAFMGERRLWLMVAVSLGLPAGGWFLIEFLLDVYVPGPWV